MKGVVNMFCQKCGHENADDCMFCVSCGANIKEQMEEETIKAELLSSSKETENSDFTGNEKIPHQEKENIPPPSDKTYSPSSNYETVSTNSMAAASLVLGVIALCSCCGTWVPLLGYGCFVIFPLVSLLGLILGITGKMQISRSGGSQKGDGIALIGIVMNGLWIFLFIIYIILMVFGVVAATTLPMILDKFK
jgi:hypothetical protein